MEYPYAVDENNQDKHPIVPEFNPLIILPLFILATLVTTVISRKKHLSKLKR